MRTKHLVKKHQKLLRSSNFLNAQNFVLWKHLEVKVYDKYKKTHWLVEKLYLFLVILLFVWCIFTTAFLISGSVAEFFLGPIFFILIISLIFLENFLKWVRRFFLFVKYKIFKFNFTWKKYIFRKRIRNNIYKNDYIIFKK